MEPGGRGMAETKTFSETSKTEGVNVIDALRELIRDAQTT
jgi:hypothetical protein